MVYYQPQYRVFSLQLQIVFTIHWQVWPRGYVPPQLRKIRLFPSKLHHRRIRFVAADHGGAVGCVGSDVVGLEAEDGFEVGGVYGLDRDYVAFGGWFRSVVNSHTAQRGAEAPL